jgi:hypothetical protein
MTQNIIRAILALGVVAVIALGGYALFHNGKAFGGAGAYEALQTQFGNGIYAGLNKQLTVDSSGNVTQSNSLATSTVKGVGCYQSYATSTATPVRIEFSTTTSLATYSGGAAPTAGLGGGVSWRYGTCP